MAALTIEELLERQEIIDCIHRYTRGVDRLDEELVLSAFHEDAVDYHGSFVGSPTEFVAWLWPRHQDRVATQHYVTNHSFDIDGDCAHVETYFLVPIRREHDATIEFSCGRYVDRFEKRDGQWKVARRVVVTEWRAQAPALEIEASSAIGLRNRDDVSYHRVLEQRPEPAKPAAASS